jgi:hypothetical protein
VANSTGQLTSIANSNSATTYTAFDGLRRVTASSQQTNGLTYGFTYTYKWDADELYYADGVFVEWRDQEFGAGEHVVVWRLDYAFDFRSGFLRFGDPPIPGYPSRKTTEWA